MRQSPIQHAPPELALQPPQYPRSADLGGGHDEPRRVHADLCDGAQAADLPVGVGDGLRAAVGAVGLAVAAVDGRQGLGAHHERVAGVVQHVHGVPGGLLARRQHLARLRGDLGGRVELQQAAAEGGRGIEVLHLVEHAHRAAQREAQVDGLHVAVREVRRELRVALGVVLGLLARHLDGERERVVARDGEQLLDVVHLLAGLHHHERDGVEDLLEGRKRVGELAVRDALVPGLEGVLEVGERVDERGGGGGLLGRVRVPRRVDVRDEGLGGGERRDRGVRGGGHVDHHVTHRLEVDDAQLAVEQPHRAVERARGRVLARQRALLHPALVGGHARRRHGEERGRPRGRGHPVVRRQVRGEVEVLHLPPAAAVVAAILVVRPLDARRGLAIAVAPEVQVEVVAPPGAALLVHALQVRHGRVLPRERPLEEAL
mmetsp:Transcript_49931/g.159765  ORF Transcript_49931/g.159765 Transcript_49931/m.159765 type:complete len:431 (-) Transcript_49931:2320-3612(-)